MTIMDKMSSLTREAFQVIFDKETVNYLEAASMYGIIAQGRLNAATLKVLYNHAHDKELKKLTKDCLENLVIKVIEDCEKLLTESKAATPNFGFTERQLHDSIEIPADARYTDEEIAAALGTMAKASQIGLLAAMHQSYQLNIGMMYLKNLNAGIDWNYRLLQLMLDRGWLPHLAKIKH